MSAIFAARTKYSEYDKWEESWRKDPVFEFELACNRSCKRDTFDTCIHCLEKSFGKAPDRIFENSSKQNDSDTSPQTADNNLEEIQIQDPVEVDANVTKNTEGSHKLLWNLPDECYTRKFDVCKNLSCCNYKGLFSF